MHWLIDSRRVTPLPEVSRPLGKDSVPATAYLTGPMRGLPYFNFPAFDAASETLRQEGWTIHSPAEKDRDVLDISRCPLGSDDELRAQDFSLSGALAWDFTRIMESTCVIALPGWETSTGVHWEMTVAYALGKPVYQYPALTPVELPDVVTNPVRRTGSRAPGPPAFLLGYQSDDDDIWPKHAGQVGMVETTWADGSKSAGYPQEWNHSGPKGTVTIPATPLETRVVDPTTGGEKGQRATQMSTLDPVALDYVGRVGGMGAEKYDRYNYLKGYAWHLSYDAMMRHLQAFWMGEELDPESGLPHTAHAAWHCNALTSFWHRGIGTDDRPPRVR